MTRFLAGLRQVRSLVLLVLEGAVPYPMTLWYHWRYVKTLPLTAADIAAWRGPLAGVHDDGRREQLIAAIADVYTSEKERQARLEDKLNGQAGLLGAIYPITAAIVALAVAGKAGLPFVLASVAIIHLTLGFIAARFGVSSARRYEPQVEDVKAALESSGPPAVAVAAVKAASVIANRPRATRTNNWIWCCQVALVWSVVLTALAAILLLPGHLPGA